MSSVKQITLGVIADDFTGATDVASMLVRAGMRTVQVIGVPQGPVPDADAIVIALKSRTIPTSSSYPVASPSRFLRSNDKTNKQGRAKLIDTG